MMKVTYQELVELGDYFDDVEEVIDYVKCANLLLNRLGIVPDGHALIFPKDYDGTPKEDMMFDLWVLLTQVDKIKMMKGQ